MRYFTSILFLLLNFSIYSQEKSIQNSRSNCVLIYSNSGNSVGSGFFIDKYHIATCFHVVTKNDEKGSIIYFNDLVVVNNSGERFKASILTKVAPEDSTPLKHDFAILSLIITKKGKSVNQIIIFKLSLKDIFKNPICGLKNRELNKHLNTSFWGNNISYTKE